MKTKKLFAMLLTLLMVIVIATPLMIASAEGTVLFTVSNVQGEIGDQVNVTVDISANSDIGALTIDLCYDKTMLDLISSQSGATLSVANSITDVVPNEDEGKVRLTYINMDGLNGSGTILNVTFTILSGATGTIPLTLDVTEITDTTATDSLVYDITDGSVEVTEAASSEPAASSEAPAASSEAPAASSAPPVASSSAPPAASSAAASSTGGTGGTSSSAGGNGNPSTGDIGIIIALAGLASSGVLLTAKKRK